MRHASAFMFAASLAFAAAPANAQTAGAPSATGPAPSAAAADPTATAAAPAAAAEREWSVNVTVSAPPATVRVGEPVVLDVSVTHDPLLQLVAAAPVGTQFVEQLRSSPPVVDARAVVDASRAGGVPAGHV